MLDRNVGGIRENPTRLWVTLAGIGISSGLGYSPLGGAVERKSVTSFYRVSKRYPPDERSYLTPRDKLGDPPADASEEKMRSWDALSAFDTEEGARRQARMFTLLGNLIVRYDIPDESGITWEQSGEPGHFDLRGDAEELKRYLADVVDV
jgi:hypothetical protein